jgi:hypothetical protein
MKQKDLFKIGFKELFKMDVSCDSIKAAQPFNPKGLWIYGKMLQQLFGRTKSELGN